MKEAEPLQYGKLTAKDYIPGAEILPETSQVEEQQKEQGDDTVTSLDIPCVQLNRSFISTLEFLAAEHNDSDRINNLRHSCCLGLHFCSLQCLTT